MNSFMILSRVTIKTWKGNVKLIKHSSSYIEKNVYKNLLSVDEF